VALRPDASVAGLELFRGRVPRGNAGIVLAQEQDSCAIQAHLGNIGSKQERERPVGHDPQAPTPTRHFNRVLEGGRIMKQITVLLVAATTLAGVVAFTAITSRHSTAQEIFVTKIPPGYRDWKVISVAHEEGDLNDIRDQCISSRKAPVPGRHDYWPNRLELHPVGGKQQSLRPSPIFRGRRRYGFLPAVHGQGLKEVRRDRWLGVLVIR